MNSFIQIKSTSNTITYSTLLKV